MASTVKARFGSLRSEISTPSSVPSFVRRSTNSMRSPCLSSLVKAPARITPPREATSPTSASTERRASTSPRWSSQPVATLASSASASAGAASCARLIAERTEREHLVVRAESAERHERRRTGTRSAARRWRGSPADARSPRPGRRARRRCRAGLRAGAASCSRAAAWRWTGSRPRRTGAFPAPDSARGCGGSAWRRILPAPRPPREVAISTCTNPLASLPPARAHPGDPARRRRRRGAHAAGRRGRARELAARASRLAGGAARRRACSRGQPWLDEVIVFPRDALARRAARAAGSSRSARDGAAPSRADLRGARFDLVLDFHAILKSGLLARLSGRRARVSYARPFAREGAAWFATDRAPARAAEAEPLRSQRGAAALPRERRRAAGAVRSRCRPPRSRASTRRSAPGRRPVVIHPGTSDATPYKRWTAAGYASVARALARGRACPAW